MKSTIMFVCQECGYESPKFLGKCPECQEWNTLREFKIQNSKFKNSSSNTINNKFALNPNLIANINQETKDRISTGISEMDTVLGGGVVSGSVILLAGDPGVGKSTLLLQVALNLSIKQKKETESQNTVLYVSGEESGGQVKLRADRLSRDLKKNQLYVLSSTDPDSISLVIQDKKPSFVIIDSIQTMASENLDGLSGSVGQVRYSAFQFIKIAKTLNIPVIIVGHVTKDGMVAGPMMLSHMVDTVLFLEGDKNTGTRLLRSFKNRFGPVDEVGIFAMQGEGMIEVLSPESLFLEKAIKAPGSVITATIEGTRAFLIEIQALAIHSKLPMPRRVVSGFDAKRLELILAVLQKHARLPLDQYDIFVSVAGGFKITDPAADLCVGLSVYSSLKNIDLSKKVAIAEVGLLGELRMPSLLDKRIKEAKKLGFNDILTPKSYKTVVDVINKL